MLARHDSSNYRMMESVVVILFLAFQRCRIFFSWFAKNGKKYHCKPDCGPGLRCFFYVCVCVCGCVCVPALFHAPL